MARAFRTVRHVQLNVNSVSKIAKRMLKEFKEVREVLNTHPVAWQIYEDGRFSRRSPTLFALLTTTPLALHKSS